MEEHSRSAALSRSLQKRSSIGRMNAWKSRMLHTVELRPPMMVMDTLHCIDLSLLVMATDPFWFVRVGIPNFCPIGKPWDDHGVVQLLDACS
jgi:hypothetical protein